MNGIVILFALKDCKKGSYLPNTLQLLFTAATIFSTVLSMDNNFHNDFLEKNFAVSPVVIKGLYLGCPKLNFTLDSS